MRAVFFFGITSEKLGVAIHEKKVLDVFEITHSVIVPHPIARIHAIPARSTREDIFHNPFLQDRLYLDGALKWFLLLLI